MRRASFILAALALTLAQLACSHKPDPNTLVMLIESSPTNLDPRIGVDAQSERIDNLIFDDLLSRGDNSMSRPASPNVGKSPTPHLHFSLAPRRKVPRRPPADLTRCEMDVRFSAR